MTKALVNRVEEISAINEFISQPQTQPQIKILSAFPHSGLTYFLRHCAITADKSQIFLYADGAKHEGNSLFSQLISELYEKYYFIWNEFYNRQETFSGRSDVRQLSTVAAESIPYFGRFISRTADLAFPTFPVSAYSSIAAELLCKLFVEISEKHRICLFLDNVQELDDWSAQLLSSTVGKAYRGIRYVAGFVSRGSNNNSNVSNFALKQKDIGYRTLVNLFPPPDDKFVQLYASSYDLKWPSDQCEAIATIAEGDIYKIRSAIAISLEKGVPHLISTGNFSDLANRLRTLLAISKQNLRLSDLLTLTLGDETIFVKDENEILKTVAELSAIDELDIVNLPDGDKLISLRPSPDKVIKELNHSIIETAQLEAKLYNYFSRVEGISGRHSASEIAPLLFRLAKKVDSEHLNLRLREIIRLSLQMGSQTIAEEFINCAIIPDPTEQSLQDYLARLAFLVSVKKFRAVLDLTEIPPNTQWLQNRTVGILRGIALNRLRRHAESDSLLAELSDTSTSLEEMVVLVSYRIVGKIHANDVSSARKLFESYQETLSDAANYGYFLRNGAEVYDSRQGVNILNTALKYHEKQLDTFGIATTLCNRGAKLAQTGSAETGLADVEKAYDMLEVFGINHLNIVIGDLAHCLLYMGMYEQAESTCQKALRYMGNDLPRAYTLINLAAAQLLQGKKDTAISTVKDVVEGSKNAMLDRIRQKAYFNGALIALFADAPAEYVRSLCHTSYQYPDRRYPDTMTERMGKIESLITDRRDLTVDDFFSFYSPCSMYYWYQNPLEGLPSNFLTLETMS
ncbi:MAG TPA: tetratricopeptide repeat protein [Pyrinomonadaceae bacterium]|jgi:tetratricopeptide (TPR) repeat protein|nr:tetratricopeptide repeat protein [Pyrinomonadaceae bacterium]